MCRRGMVLNMQDKQGPILITIFPSKFKFDGNLIFL